MLRSVRLSYSLQLVSRFEVLVRVLSALYQQILKDLVLRMEVHGFEGGDPSRLSLLLYCPNFIYRPVVEYFLNIYVQLETVKS
mmetsp:Transcript_52316/g.52698  ORF Transcript_52316/g.52698 Transcript_52316/m.52698 type:complete len:83 (+) Transcript_52316:625-873(+)